MMRNPTASTMTTTATMVIQLNCMGFTLLRARDKGSCDVFIASAVQASTTNVAELGISKLGATQKIAEPAKQAMSIKLWRQPQLREYKLEPARAGESLR